MLEFPSLTLQIEAVHFIGKIGRQKGEANASFQRRSVSTKPVPIILPVTDLVDYCVLFADLDHDSVFKTSDPIWHAALL